MTCHLLQEYGSKCEWMVVSCESLINMVPLTELLNLYVSIVEGQSPEERGNSTLYMSGNQEG